MTVPVGGFSFSYGLDGNFLFPVLGIPIGMSQGEQEQENPSVLVDVSKKGKGQYLPCRSMKCLPMMLLL
jgi:hypothetical protein